MQNCRRGSDYCRSYFGRYLLGALKDFDEGKTLAEYIEIYKRNTLKANIKVFSEAFGFDKDKLARIMVFHLKEEKLYEGGLLIR